MPKNVESSNDRLEVEWRIFIRIATLFVTNQFELSVHDKIESF